MTNSPRVNEKMSALLNKAELSWPLPAPPGTVNAPVLSVVEDCVLLKGQWEINRDHVALTGLPDRTGFECFLNHVHLPFGGTSESLRSCLEYAATLREALLPLSADRRFRVIVAVSEDGDCAVRFHQIREGETWISENIEGYRSEGVLVFDIPS